MDENAKTDAPDGASAQPEPTGTTPAPEQSAPQKSAAETKLEGQLKDAKAKGDGYKKERDGYKKDLETMTKQLENVTTDRDNFAKAYEGAEADATRYKEALEALDQADREQNTPIAVSQETEVKELLKRNGLPTAWLLPDGNVCFSEAHAKHVAGEDFDSLTTISAE